MGKNCRMWDRTAQGGGGGGQARTAGIRNGGWAHVEKNEGDG